MYKQVNFRFDKNIADMLDALIKHYSYSNYTKTTKTGVMQELILRDYEKKIGSVQGDTKDEK